MKQSEIIALGLAAVAVYMILQARKPAAQVAAAQSGKPAGWISEVLGLGGSAFGNGWRYFDNGVAIDPSGNYYQNGAMVYQAAGAGA